VAVDSIRLRYKNRLLKLPSHFNVLASGLESIDPAHKVRRGNGFRPTFDMGGASLLMESTN
jgi:hypothetical protein